MKIFSHKNNTDKVQEFCFENGLSDKHSWAHILVDLNTKEFFLKKETGFKDNEFEEILNFPFPSHFLSDFLKKTGDAVREFEVSESIDETKNVRFYRFKDKKNSADLLEIRIDNIQKEFLVRYSSAEKTDSKWNPGNQNTIPVSLFNDFLRSC